MEDVEGRKPPTNCELKMARKNNNKKNVRKDLVFHKITSPLEFPIDGVTIVVYTQ